MEFGLAQVIGRYLHAVELSSPVLGSFYQALQAPGPAGPLPYFQKLQAIALDAQSEIFGSRVHENSVDEPG